MNVHTTELPPTPTGADADDLSQQVTLRLFPDGSGDGLGPSGIHHVRFRVWKQDLLGRSWG